MTVEEELNNFPNSVDLWVSSGSLYIHKVGTFAKILFV